MDILYEILHNKYVVVPFLTWLAIQCFKVIWEFITLKKFNIKRLFGAGGMPSSHSAAVMGLGTTVGIIEGFDSISFAVAFGFALITMYDAAGVRRAAGKTAACLNRMMEDFYHHDVQAIGGKLKELLGHTPFEVIVGAMLGIFLAYYIHYQILL